jgi:hypothetical protein
MTAILRPAGPDGVTGSALPRPCRKSHEIPKSRENSGFAHLIASKPGVDEPTMPARMKQPERIEQVVKA